MRLPSILLLTDRRQLPPGRELVETVARCVDAGAEVVVLRELDLPAECRLDICARLAKTGATVISAHTLLAPARGVHLSSAQSASDARPTLLHGTSCHHDEEVVKAVAGGASYVTISPVATTASKPGYGPPVGAAGVRRAAELAGHVPVFALGGVDAHNAAAMRAAGAYGVAAMGAVMRANDPALVVTKILEQLR